MGDIRNFTDGRTSIRVIAHIQTGAFERAIPSSKIDEIILLNVTGDKEKAVEMLAGLNAKFKGCSFGEWLTQTEKS